MIDGEHYIRNLSDSELERFVGLNRSMYTKQELHIADDEMAKRKRARAAKAAQPQPTAAAKPQAVKPEPAPRPAANAPIPAVEFKMGDFVVPEVKIPELPKLEDMKLPEIQPEPAKPEAVKPEAAKPQAPRPQETARPAQAARPAPSAAVAKRNYNLPNAGPAAVPDEPKPTGAFMFCTTCGRKLALDAEYCTNCGNRVSLADMPEKVKQPVRPQTSVYYGPSRRSYRSNMDCCSSDECG